MAKGPYTLRPNDVPEPMTLVDICIECETLFVEGEEHCRRCGADRRTSSVKREMKDLCPTYTGDEVEVDETKREVRPIFEPQWGKVQWYETGEGRKRRTDDEDD